MIAARIRKAGRNQVIWAVLMLGTTAALLGLNHRYWYNFAFGPFPFDETIGGEVDDPETFPRSWVVLRGYPSQDLGVQEASSERITRRYFTLSVGHRFLLVEVAPDFPGGSITNGEIAMIPYPLRNYLGGHLFKQDPTLAAKYFSFMARAGSYRSAGWIALLVCAPIVLVGLSKLRKGVSWLSAPASHPVMSTLARYGDPLIVRGEIEAAVQGGQLFRVLDTVVTDRWLLQERGLGIDVCRLEDIVWIYKTTPSHSVIVRDRDGQSLLLHAQTLENADSLLAHVARRTPWAFVGYDGELDRSWYRDRGAVIQAAMERKEI